jgi:integrase
MEPKPKFTPNPKLKLMDQVRQVLRYHHYAMTTERTYCAWILRFIRYFHAKRHPREMGAPQIEAFLSHLASEVHVSVATQRQAHNAIIFLYKHVLNIPLEAEIAPIRARRRPRLPVVMSKAETLAVLNQMSGLHLLMAELLYGAGLRLMECVRLRVNSIDLSRSMIYVRFGKGSKDRSPITLPIKSTPRWPPSGSIMEWTWPRGLVKPGCRRRLPERSDLPPKTWAGSIYSRRRSAASTRAAASNGDTMSSNPVCKRRFAAPSNAPV